MDGMNTADLLTTCLFAPHQHTSTSPLGVMFVLCIQVVLSDMFLGLRGKWEARNDTVDST